MKNKLGKSKNSGIKNVATKTIPLSVALSLFASSSVMAATPTIGAGKIAVDVGGGIATFRTDLMGDDDYRESAIKWLQAAWTTANPIYFSSNDTHFVDFSSYAEPGKSITQVMEAVEAQATHIDGSDGVIELITADQLGILDETNINSLYNF